MSRKITSNYRCVKNYLNLEYSKKQEVNNLFKQYLSSSETLGELGIQIEKTAQMKCSRKEASALLTYLGYPKKTKDMQDASRLKKLREKSKAQHNNYALNQLKELEKKGCSQNDFINLWKEQSFKYFKDNYGLSQYQVESIVEYLHLTEHKTIYTYMDVLNELKNNHFEYNEIYNYYITLQHSKGDLLNIISKIVQRNIGEKRLDKLLKKLDIHKSKRGLAFAKSQRSIAMLKANKKKLAKAGYTLKSLADKYNNDYTLTKTAILKEINSHLSKNDKPLTERWLQRNLDPLLDKVRLGSISREEKKFQSILINRYPNLKFQFSRRDIIAPQELDVYIPEYKLAFEFNGNYWHSDEFMLYNHDMTAVEYHKSKVEQCKKLGITLLFVWESDWDNHKDKILKSIDNYIKNKEINNILLKLQCKNKKLHEDKNVYLELHDNTIANRSKKSTNSSSQGIFKYINDND